MWHSAHKIITLVGTNTGSWERVKNTLQDLHTAKIQELDMQISDGRIIAYRAKVMVPSEYHDEEEVY